MIEEKATRTDAQRRLDSQLPLELLRRRGHPVARAVPGLSTGIETDPDGGTLVDIKADVTGALLARIEALGGTVFSQHPRYRAIQARLPLTSLETLAADASVQSIRPAFRPINNKIDTSEGDVAHVADEARATFGVDGTGIKVCALSDSVDYLGSLQGTGDLPAVTVLPGQSGNPGTSEGTAMLEIIHDLAPGAELYFATAFSNKATFAANILALRAAGCDILVDDVFYPEEGGATGRHRRPSRQHRDCGRGLLFLRRGQLGQHRRRHFGCLGRGFRVDLGATLTCWPRRPRLRCWEQF